LINPIALNGNLREIRVIDNPNGTNDRAIIAAPLTGAGNAGITKSGDGTLVLTASNTCAGATVVTNGALLIDGVLNSAGSKVTVCGGAVLGGTGTIYRAVNVASNGVLAPGDSGSVGTLTIASNLNLAAGTVDNWDVDRGVGDRVNVGGTMTLPANATVNVTVLGGSFAADAVLFRANQVAGATDLSSWTVNGVTRHCRVVLLGNEVRITGRPGALLRVQ
jgi:autotransporter-associated beta strand protein